jgi:hypothetical protein
MADNNNNDNNVGNYGKSRKMYVYKNSAFNDQLHPDLDNENDRGFQYRDLDSIHTTSFNAIISSSTSANSIHNNNNNNKNLPTYSFRNAGNVDAAAAGNRNEEEDENVIKYDIPDFFKMDY